MNILVTLPMAEAQRIELEQMDPGASYHYTKYKSVTRELVQEANIIIGNVPPEFIEGSANLEWLQLNSAGTDGYCNPGVLAEGTILTNASGAYGLSIGEFMVGLTFALKKNTALYVRNQINHRWHYESGVSTIMGSTVLVIGLGDIGMEYAKRMKALGSHVIGVKRRKSEKPEYVDELYYEEDVDRLLGRADIVALSMPAYDKTMGFMSEERFKKMKSSAIILNVGRGSLIDTEVLYRALKEKWIAGAGLDVITPEPFPKDHPLWDLDNLILTPHVSGGYSIPETLERIVGIALENRRRFAVGEPLKNRIDFETGYRL
ncbi:D-2-hydroxyacid dehydrogenase [Robinsoniella peoriensis]|uniref:Glycerate dehydrogenase n=1 Tax=Robinsoniella peoriensis TaxID=180332 RepID=A0A4U8QA30_9FIRM|nr:D-2-hydroxyacid dehydrogenase [Robinsoniella peoriensis]TLD01304.1 Glycerate dehydrogenase [Robinsoniella peoriensis]